MVLAQDLSSVARWLGSISAHQKIYIPQIVFPPPPPLFFFFFSSSSYWSMPVFSSSFFNFQIRNSKFDFFFLNIANKIKMHTKENKMSFFFFFFFSGLLTSAAPRADVITGKAAQVKVTGLNSRSWVKTMAQVLVE
jgi:hypothetical protein